MKKTLCTLSLLLCASILPAQAAESIVLDNIAIDRVQKDILRITSNAGTTPVSSTQDEIVFEFPYAATDLWGEGAITRHIYRFKDVTQPLPPMPTDTTDAAAPTEELPPEEPLTQTELTLEVQRVMAPGTADEKIVELSFDRLKKLSKARRADAIHDAAYAVESLRQMKLGYNGGYWIGFTPAAAIEDKAVTVEAITPNSPAEKAGLLAGDKILKVNKDKVAKNSYVYFDALLNRTNLFGEPLTLQVLRGEEKMKITIEPTYVSSSLGVTQEDVKKADEKYAAQAEAAKNGETRPTPEVVEAAPTPEAPTEEAPADGKKSE